MKLIYAFTIAVESSWILVLLAVRRIQPKAVLRNSQPLAISLKLFLAVIIRIKPLAVQSI